jgi:hypothetical protein
MAPPPAAGRPAKKSGRFTKRTRNGNGRDRKAERAAKRAKTMVVPVPVDADAVTNSISEDDEATTTAQHVQVLDLDLLQQQDIIVAEDTTYEDYEDNHFLTAEVKEELGNFFDRKEEAKRICVVYLFVSVHNANPDEATWSGQNGIINKIRKAMELSPKARLEYILRDALEHRRLGKKYEGKRISNVNNPSGRPAFIDLKSIEAQIIADAMESGFDAAKALLLVNKHCEEIGQESYTITPVQTCYRNLKPKFKKIKKRSQGFTDAKSPWCKARKNWYSQLLIRFGSLPEDELEKLRDPATGLLPAWFDIEQLKKLHTSQVGWWDETHKKCQIGGMGNATHAVRFPRDANGRLDLEEGTYDETEITYLSVKYEKEVRLCLGCAVTKDTDGNEKGRTAIPFDYSGKIILSILDYEKRKKTEIERVRTGLKDGGAWVVDPSVPGSIYSVDSIKELAHIGGVTVTKLKEGFNIKTVGDLKACSPEKIIEIVALTKGLSMNKLGPAHAQAQTCIDGEHPSKIDYRKADNPYAARFGDDRWVEKIKAVSQMSSYVCITDLVEHIVEETQRLMKGTKHEDDWVFYHDALTLMTAKETVEWMKKEGHFERWLLPANGLHTDDASLKYYFMKPVGNSPEMMPWDTSLNQDVKCAVDRHVMSTADFLEDDPLKFSLSTPKRGARAFMRVLEGVPSSERIIHDVTKVIESMVIVQSKSGVLVQGVGNRNSGVRHEPLGFDVKAKNPSGKRKSSPHDYGGKWTHAAAQDALAIKLEESRGVVQGTRVKQETKWTRKQTEVEISGENPL